MEVLRYKYIFITTLLLVTCVSNEETKNKPNSTTPHCPLSRIIEDVFRINNRTLSKDPHSKEQNRERVKLFLNTIANITNENVSRKEEDLIDVIIASINRIKNNITGQPDKLNEAIILNPNNTKKVNQIKSGIEEKVDTARVKKQTTKSVADIEEYTERPKFVEVLTIPSTKQNTTSANIIEVLKHLMPLFNSTLAKEVHNITIIERGRDDNQLLSAKNVSTIIVTYCDKENLTKENTTLGNVSDEKQDVDDPDEDFYVDDDELDLTDEGEPRNITVGEKREIMEAAEYGMQKMHELYTVLEPKLYSMGLWLDDTSPARYVAAFNAPSEEAVKFSRYGYASLQAAAKLKQLTSCRL
ncbi:uncharacterized protein LOC142974868 [Anticarsia gemmatalis]|uniref:uncharacterized protein LOC142974868 n=1 Tax=Anticarsia gemmatalis TaxID=129554 RepID=UPI003F76979C